MSNINFTSDRVINPQIIFWLEISYQNRQLSCMCHGHFKDRRFYQKKLLTHASFTENLFELCILLYICILIHPSLGSRFLTVKRQWALSSPPVMVTIITICTIFSNPNGFCLASYAMRTLVMDWGYMYNVLFKLMRGMVSLLLHVHIGEELHMNIYTSA